ncbi:MAG: outer membrane protein transport protein, partial [Deltaproteobacteria bacterium]|nr:outer membrane protein transport protein [Deltaproteobacteria bacterium]
MLRHPPILVLVLWLLAPQPGQAGGFSNPDTGVRRMGMFAVMAKSDDPTTVFHNPAGMIWLEGTHLYHSQAWFIVDFGARLYDSQGVLRPGHEIRPEWNVGALPFLAVTTDFGGIEWFRMGLAVYAPNAYGAVMPSDEPTRYHATQVLFLASRATLAAAFRVTPRFTLGVSADLVNLYLSAKRFMNPLVLSDPDMRFAAADVLAPYDAKLSLDGHGWSWAWNLGLLFRPTERFSLGMGFASGSPVHLEGNVDLRYADGSREHTRQSTDFSIPFTLRAGFNWEFIRDFEVAADVFYWHYQVFQEQRMELRDPIMGMEEFVDPKNYGNSWAWNVGLLYRVIPPLELMAG